MRRSERLERRERSREVVSLRQLLRFVQGNPEISRSVLGELLFGPRRAARLSSTPRNE